MVDNCWKLNEAAGKKYRPRYSFTFGYSKYISNVRCRRLMNIRHKKPFWYWKYYLFIKFEWILSNWVACPVVPNAHSIFLFFWKAQEITDAVDLRQMNPNEKCPYHIVAKCDFHLMNYPISFFFAFSGYMCWWRCDNVTPSIRNGLSLMNK